MAEPVLAGSARGEGVEPLGRCPSCGEPSPEPVFTGRAWNFLCLSCGTCSHFDDGGFAVVDPLTCPGCRLRDFCRASPSPLAGELTYHSVIPSGVSVTVRPVVHTDLPSFCALAAKARVESGTAAPMGADAVDDLLVSALCAVSDVDVDSFTWIVLIDEDPARSLPVAVVTFHRCEDDATCARAALVVDSSYRDQGLGPLLYSQLVSTAREYGIESLCAEMVMPSAIDVERLAKLGVAVSDLGSGHVEMCLEPRSRPFCGEPRACRRAA